jgi:hypothetical protein
MRSVDAQRRRSLFLAPNSTGAGLDVQGGQVSGTLKGIEAQSQPRGPEVPRSSST